MSECPCWECDARKTYERELNQHIWGGECHYQCDSYDSWKEQQLKVNREIFNTGEPKQNN